MVVNLFELNHCLSVRQNCVFTSLEISWFSDF